MNQITYMYNVHYQIIDFTLFRNLYCQLITLMNNDYLNKHVPETPPNTKFLNVRYNNESHCRTDKHNAHYYNHNVDTIRPCYIHYLMPKYLSAENIDSSAISIWILKTKSRGGNTVQLAVHLHIVSLQIRLICT